MARAPALQAGGRGFEPHILHQGMHQMHARFFDRIGRKADTKRRINDKSETRRRESVAGLTKSEKRARAYGGCLGSRRRRRTRQAAKDRGEARAALDPRVSEWGNPPCAGTASP